MATPEVNPWAIQVGGNHYKNLAIQPSEYIHKNGLNWFRGNVVKYVSRVKGDLAKQIEDLEKAKQYIDLEIAELRDRQQREEAASAATRLSWMEVMREEMKHDAQ